MLSIIVPARNNAESTARASRAFCVSVSRLQLNCEFVLVDDASAPQEHILMFSGSIAYRLRATTRKSSGRISTNIILVFLYWASSHDARYYFFHPSNDMVLTTSFFQALLLVSSLSRDFGIVRGTSNYTDGQLGTHCRQSKYRRIPKNWQIEDTDTLHPTHALPIGNRARQQFVST